MAEKAFRLDTVKLPIKLHWWLKQIFPNKLKSIEEIKFQGWNVLHGGINKPYINNL